MGSTRPRSAIAPAVMAAVVAQNCNWAIISEPGRLEGWEGRERAYLIEAIQQFRD